MSPAADDHAVEDHAHASHAVTGHAVTDHVVSDRALTDHAVTDHALPSHEVAGQGVAGHVVEDRAKGRIITDAPLSRPVPVALRFDADTEPATVRFVFPGSIEWSFPRALLETGMRAPARRGDIGVWPCGRVQTVVEFHTGDGVAVVQFDSTALVRFLRHTYAATASATTR